MAGSRVHRLGTIFSRVNGLIRSGALAESEKPIWYDVYEAFPPCVAPALKRTVQEEPPQEILYYEDVIRAKFQKVYGSPGIVDLTDLNSESVSQRFINKYISLAEHKTDAENLFEATAEALNKEGYNLQTLEEIREETKKAREEKRKKMEQAPQPVMPSVADVFGSGVAGGIEDAPDHIDEDEDFKKR